MMKMTQTITKTTIKKWKQQQQFAEARAEGDVEAAERGAEDVRSGHDTDHGEGSFCFIFSLKKSQSQIAIHSFPKLSR